MTQGHENVLYAHLALFKACSVQSITFKKLSLSHFVVVLVVAVVVVFCFCFVFVCVCVCVC